MTDQSSSSALEKEMSSGSVVTATAPVQYKLIKARKPDGTIVNVRRPISAAEAEALAKAEKDAVATSAPMVAKSTPQPISGRIISARKPDGTIIQVKKPVEESAKKSETPPAQQSQTEKANNEKVKAGSPEIKPATTVEAVDSRTEESADSAVKIEPSPTSNAPKPSDEVQKGQETRLASNVRLFSTLGQLGGHAYKIVGSFNPEWNIEEFEDGDEVLDDDETDDDYYSDDDDLQENQGDQDDQDNHNHDTQDSNASIGLTGLHPPTYQMAQASVDAASQLLKAADSTKGQKAVALGSQQVDEKTKSAASNAASSQQVKKSPPASLPSPTSESSNPTSPRKLPDSPTFLSARSNKTRSRFSEQEFSVHEEKGTEDATEKLESPLVGRKLNKRSSDWTKYVVWSIMILFPVLFIILGVLSIVRNGKPLDSEFGLGVAQGLNVGVSAWPIIFAAITAQSLRAYATYKVERGVRLMTLEQLVGSQSVASAVKQPFLLHRLDLLTIALLCLWALSPLASQAMVRLPSQEMAQTVTYQELVYVNTSAKNLAFDIIDHPAATISSYDTDINRIYAAAFLPGSNISTDLWNSPIVPLADQTGVDADSDGWHAVDPFNSVSNFSSVFGLNFAAFEDRPTDYSNFTTGIWYDAVMTAGYLKFTCDPLTKISADQIVAQPGNNTMQASLSGTLRLAIQPQVQLPSGEWVPGNITFNSQVITPDTVASNGSKIYAHTTCTMTQKFVEAQFHCEKYICSMNGVRPAAGTYSNSTMKDFAAKFVASSGGGATDNKTTTSERFLWDPDNIDIFDDTNYDLTRLDHFTFESRLSKLLNTYWQIGFSPMYMTGDLKLNNPYGVITNTANMTRTEEYLVYSTNLPWLGVLEASAIILLVAGVVCVICDSQAMTPDILGFVSSVARRSRYVDLPKMDGSVSGADRARALADVKVMMQDVRPKAPVGKIALGSLHKNSARLKKGRLYR